ncbi:hypothetical protein [Paracoccus sp. MC1862]|uniref:hypothetical protein n=1 Tax=Paracoccus sp. MC1862 TaxID=2760307 RepID=UPI0016046EC6|nr:hypothetical protein [Paracoccus sp. MC1862]MBB1496818.1 hypothetical protein [Paracoccus sp. MC1862]QQO45447.1 hypothetical protein JGR78_03585 [Paracoccus sp. MC1862]
MQHCDHRQPAGLAGSIEFIRLEETLQEFAEDETFIFVANTGNWGDGLIRYATEKFFRHNAFRYVSVPLGRAMSMSPDDLRQLSSSSKVRMVYGGGGAFLNKYRMHKKMPALIERSERMLVLPNTFAVPRRSLGFRRTDILFRRDEGGSKEFAPRSIFCHDMALSLGRITTSGNGSGVGYFFRGDVEKIEDMPVPEGNRDISTEGKESTPMSGFLDAIARFGTIHTNRLHVSIAAAMMGRRVHLYANSYFKNNSIYEASLKQAFSNLTFHQRYTAPSA